MEHQWTIIKSCDNLPLVIGMNLPHPSKPTTRSNTNTIEGFETFRSLKNIGFDMVVTCCATQHLKKTPSILTVLDIEHKHLEWDRYRTVESDESLKVCIDQVAENVLMGRRVIICCPDGTGNTAVFACALFVRMMHTLEHTLTRLADLVHVIRRMGPPAAITSKQQYLYLMQLLNVPELEINPWEEIHEPSRVVGLTKNYFAQHQHVRNKNVICPIMMNDYTFKLCLDETRQ